ncbi:hypothetical protein L8X28_02410 [Campylobacter sp. CNRCH_2016_0050h]|nr:hypothetical protein [Campylobacter sp. CNRCH_2016_0050h]MCV3456618.1 hypothetical protein [Campylobacter sp. CNRCH_2016_0050h]
MNKPFTKLENLNLNKQNELLLKAYYRINKDIQICEKLSKNFNDELELVSNDVDLTGYQNNKELLENIMHQINTIKTKVEGLLMHSLCEVLNPLIRQFELNLARIYVLNPKTQEDSYNKSMLWIKEHLDWIKLIIAHIDSQKEVLQRSIVTTKDELIEKGFLNLVEKIEQRALKNVNF